jgi:predicted metal-dependent phosphoesterase TrpH
MNEPTERWRKSELHAHCGTDPVDYRVCPYTAQQLIFEAARQGYEILAITCHNLDIWTRELSDYAEGLGITLIPGMEATVERSRHLLVYNFGTGCWNLDRLGKVRDLMRGDTLVIAPHSFYPGPTCLGRLIRNHTDIFDAFEISGFYTSQLDFNRRARHAAEACGKPLVGNGDIHFLWQLGRTFSWVYCRPGVASAIQAVKRGRVRVESAPLSAFEAAGWWATTAWRTVFPVNSRPSNPLLDPLYE